jgi:hypothetical protein
MEPEAKINDGQAHHARPSMALTDIGACDPYSIVG